MRAISVVQWEKIAECQNARQSRKEAQKSSVCELWFQ